MISSVISLHFKTLINETSYVPSLPSQQPIDGHEEGSQRAVPLPINFLSSNESFFVLLHTLRSEEAKRS